MAIHFLPLLFGKAFTKIFAHGATKAAAHHGSRRAHGKLIQKLGEETAKTVVEKSGKRRRKDKKNASDD
ncbi:MAG: hypothetical protein WBP94_02330 [Rhodomicrobiaceae bacterium]